MPFIEFIIDGLTDKIKEELSVAEQDKFSGIARLLDEAVGALDEVLERYGKHISPTDASSLKTTIDNLCDMADEYDGSDNNMDEEILSDKKSSTSSEENKIIDVEVIK